MGIIYFQILSKHSTGPEPLNSWLKAYPFRVIFGLVAAGIVAITPMLLRTTPLPIYFILLLFLYALHQVCCIIQSIYIK